MHLETHDGGEGHRPEAPLTIPLGSTSGVHLSVTLGLTHDQLHVKPSALPSHFAALLRYRPIYLQLPLQRQG